VGSKLLQKKWEQKEREMHLSKLKDAKPSVDVREPTQFRHIKKKLKKNQILEGKQCLSYDADRYTEIERENRILLEKMTHIMQTTTNNSGLLAMGATQTNMNVPPTAGGPLSAGNRGNIYSASQ
jgi:hypothetical protein